MRCAFDVVLSDSTANAPAQQDNPAEELNLIDLSNPSSVGSFFGYPNCYTAVRSSSRCIVVTSKLNNPPQWNFTADGAPSTFGVGDQFSIPINGSRDDAWCADTVNNVRPVLSLQVERALSLLPHRS